MKRLSHAKRRDANEPEIVEALEAIGCDVDRLDEFDLLVGRAGLSMCLEVKTPTGTLTASQKRRRANWRGHFAIVRSVDEAIAEVTRHTTGRRK